MYPHGAAKSYPTSMSLRGGTTKQSRTMHNYLLCLRLPRFARNDMGFSMRHSGVLWLQLSAACKLKGYKMQPAGYSVQHRDCFVPRNDVVGDMRIIACISKQKVTLTAVIKG
nr:hypothetical protein [Mucilaginibacter sp. SP1R1]